MEKATLKYRKRQQINLLPSLRDALPGGLFVVVPAYAENETLPYCIDSLLAAGCRGLQVNVLIVVNHAGNDLPHVKEASEQLALWCEERAKVLRSDDFRLLVIRAFDLDPKTKGAGLARKIGMDQVVAFCDDNGLADGIIVSLDADTTVERNYFQALSTHFSVSENNSCSLYFEHPLARGGEIDFRSEAIALYELHLRYYRQALQAAGFPYAMHTVGSAMACRVSAYAKAGGMTQKQAGEDFYFMHKLVYQGGFHELNQTTVFPSARASTRVVFGTGATIQKMEEEGVAEYLTYNMQAFIDLSALFNSVSVFYSCDAETYEQQILKLPGRVRSFLVNQSFRTLIEPIIRHCASASMFDKRFFEVFNAFMVIKYLNFTHEHFLEKPDVERVAAEFLETNGLLDDPFADVFALLDIYRALDKEGRRLVLCR